MKWSKYNYILDCKHGIFIYNSMNVSLILYFLFPILCMLHKYYELFYTYYNSSTC